jgi:hypothetical protein
MEVVPATVPTALRNAASFLLVVRQAASAVENSMSAVLLIEARTTSMIKGIGAIIMYVVNTVKIHGSKAICVICMPSSRRRLRIR